VGVHPVLDASNPDRLLADLLGKLLGRNDHGRRPVAHRRAIVLAQRRNQVGIGQDGVHLEVALELGLGVALGVATAAHGHLGHVALAVPALIEERPGL
jgi:hypothetical protein